tara:strand:+ start:438 stop:611 length:174 start_codon:yes stop_codon:yes gene_type:complete
MKNIKLTTEQIHDAAMASHDIISDNLQEWAERRVGIAKISESDLQEIKRSIGVLFTL